MAEIRTIAVIGAGAMGRGIAFAAALGGYRTILEDILPSSLRTAAAELREHLARAADLGTVSKPEALAAFNRLEYASTVEHAAREADLVIEAVPDELESKIEIFTLLDKICKPANHPGIEHYSSQRERNCFSDLSRGQDRGHAFCRSCFQQQKSANRARPAYRRRNHCRVY